MNSPLKLTGLKFGRLLVIDQIVDSRKGTWWKCQCDCGNVVEQPGSRLTFANGTRSCGCLVSETAANLAVNLNRSHGMFQSKEYSSWLNMKTRCTNPNAPAYCYYGGRGIRVCDRWLHSFENFFADMGPMPGPGYSIDRRNNDGHYEPGNCRWATLEEQMNNSRSNVMHNYDGREYTTAQLCRELGINRSTFVGRMSRGLTVEEAIRW